MKNGHTLAFDRKAEAVYRTKLKPKVEGKYKGRIVAIDVESGDYFLGKTMFQVIEKGRRKHPGKILLSVIQQFTRYVVHGHPGTVTVEREPVGVLMCVRAAFRTVALMMRDLTGASFSIQTTTG